MGAEGGIAIIKDEVMKTYEGYEKFLPFIGHGHYVHELEGKKYHTFYYGENVSSYDPFEPNPYGYALDEGFTDWEVWT